MYSKADWPFRPLNAMCKHGIMYLESLQNFVSYEALWIKRHIYLFTLCGPAEPILLPLSADVKYSVPPTVKVTDVAQILMHYFLFRFLLLPLL